MIVILLVVSSLAAVALGNIRWWRVAQREHYLPGSVSRFARRWWFDRPLNMLLAALPVTALLLGQWFEPLLLLVPLSIAVGPVGLSLRGRTSKLVWTKRLKTVAATTVALQIVAAVAVAVLSNLVVASFLVLVLADVAVDAALAILQPIEKRKAEQFVDRARKRLAGVNPTVVGITGSYGKTSTKNYLAHLVAGSRTVLPTPASFNNRAGLSRTINEHLTPGTEVFIAEMGTYSRGEIRELCEFVSPELAMITAIGPVHLERFGNEDNIVAAKSEIFDKARVCILNIDDERLARLAGLLREQGKQVRTASSINEAANVRVVETETGLRVFLEGHEVGEVEGVNAPGSNVACAIAVAVELGVSSNEIVDRLASLPVPQHRQSVSMSQEGFTVIDDTYNANPASVRRGLTLLERSAGPSRRRVVATPGMVELGSRQAEENQQFGREAGVVATDLVVIGRTNRRALVAGAKETEVNVVVVDRLPQAVAWIRQHVKEGDAVLYANDLPDHFS